MTYKRNFFYILGILGVLSVLESFGIGVKLQTDANATTDNILKRYLSNSIQALDPYKAQDFSTQILLTDVLEGLVVKDRDGEIIPGMAEKWTVSPDGLEYIFKLRKARWSNGDPITSEDFVFSFQKAMDPKTASPFAQLLFCILNAEEVQKGKLSIEKLGVYALNESEFKIVLDKPTPYIFEVLADNIGMPIHKASFLKNGNAYFSAKNFISNGAYKFVEVALGSHVALEKNEHYWDKDNVKIHKVMYLLFTDASLPMNIYKTGGLDMFFSRTTNLSLEKMRKDNPEEAFTIGVNGSSFLSLNFKSHKLKDVRVRQALSMLVDRDLIANKIIGFGHKSLYDFIPYGIQNYNQFVYDWSRWDMKKRIEAAKKLYAQAGYSKQNPLKIKFSFINISSKNTVVAASALWKSELGVQVEFSGEEPTSFMNNIIHGDFEIANMNFTSSINDVLDYCVMLTQENEQNFGRYQSKSYTELVSKSLYEANPKVRKDLVQKAIGTALNDYALIPYSNMSFLVFLKKRVGGYSAVAPRGFVPSRFLYFR
jgi:oligopeptide transport system substrate-binding protein